MKKMFIFIIITSACSIFLSVSGAASDEPSLYTAGYDGTMNLIGQSPPEYCYSPARRTPQLYRALAIETELAMPRGEAGMFAHKKLLQSERFRKDLVRCSKRSHYDFKYALISVQKNEPDFVVSVLRVNSVAMPPLLHFFLSKYLELEDIKRKNGPGHRLVPIDLKDRHGYLEWSLPSFKGEEEEESDKLQKIIDAAPKKITIESTWDAVCNWVGKKYNRRICLERKKSQSVYAYFLALVNITFRKGKTTGAKKQRNALADLACTDAFVRVYNQVWERSNALYETYLEFLQAEPSLDACRIYADHRQNTPPVFAALIQDIILELKQPQIDLISPGFIQAKRERRQPIGKYIALLVDGLSDVQKTELSTNKDAILEEAKSDKKDNIAHNIHAYIEEDSREDSRAYQIKLLMPIAQHDAVADIFHAIEMPYLPFPTHAYTIEMPHPAVAPPDESPEYHYALDQPGPYSEAASSYSISPPSGEEH